MRVFKHDDAHGNPMTPYEVSRECYEVYAASHGFGLFYNEPHHLCRTCQANVCATRTAGHYSVEAGYGN